MFDNKIDDIEYVSQSLNQATVLEQLAEESAELAQAALKLSRIIRGNNPTTTTFSEACANLYEEYADVIVAAHVAYLHKECEIERIGGQKIDRWKYRIENSKCKK